MRKAIKVRIYPEPEQVAFLNRQFGAVRYVWNKALWAKRHAWRTHGLSLSPKHDLKPLLAAAKKTERRAWLKDVDSIALQQSLINLDRAFSNFFNPKLKAKFPRFKSRRSEQSSYHCMNVDVGPDWIKIPKIGRMPAVVHREMSGKLRSITVTRSATGKYFAALLFDDGEALPDKPLSLDEDRIVGVDVGIKEIAIQSDGKRTPNPRILINAAHNLRRKQKSLSRKRKGSANRNKARRMVAAVHERIANKRNDFQHKLSRALIDDNQAVCIETLKVKNMIKNRKLVKHIADAAWGGLTIKLGYKAEWAGKYLARIDQWLPSSKSCHDCGWIHDDLSLEDRFWRCLGCDTIRDRDLNAAQNIKREGIRHLLATTAGLVVAACRGLRKTGTLPAAA